MKKAALTNAAPDIAVNLVGRILREITFHHEHLRIGSEQAGSGHVIYVQTHRADMKRVIGKQGAHRNATANLVEQIGIRYGTKLDYHLIEPQIGQDEQYPPFRHSEKWNSDGAIQLIRDCCASVFDHEVSVSLSESTLTGTSTIHIRVSAQENFRVARRMSDALEVLWNAIGKRNGRLLVVDISQS